ncbi:MAG: hypothetical protein JNM56_10480 [Planctomycetia bacterium]|nr:hypothetical protein [Planctomycetia bacterium]
MKFRNWLHQGGFAVLPLFAQAKGKGTGKFLGTQREESMIGDLIGAWWIWAGVIVLVGLIGLLVYVRNKAPSDDD